MTTQQLRLTMPTPEATQAFAATLAPRLAAGDVILLSGGIGAGKTHFARALIQSLQSPPEDVPSPTFTLVQVYDTPKGEVWHADLYRLTNPDECIELGLVDAFETAICLIEWPDKLEDLTPSDALHLEMIDANKDDSREILCRWTSPKWDQILDGAQQ